MEANISELRSRIKIGLEIHFQVSDGKLFCRCPTDSDSKELFRFERRMVATTSEMGSMDRAAKYEMERNLLSEYIATENTCLVEYDEEPPHYVDERALNAAVIASLSLNCKILDNIVFMRKVVVDGSNTSGFQRTSIIAMNGWVETARGKVRISSVSLEEDSARLLENKNGKSIYSLDRLGIPLIEIATEPDIIDENHAVETAKAIGYFVQASGFSRMTVDAIRQDVNVSFGYGRVEIKGVQKLSLIPEVISYELERQQSLLETSKKAMKYLKFYSDKPEIHDVTDLFLGTKSKVLLSNIHAGHRIYSSRMRGMAGLMKNGKYRMGKELSDLVKRYGIRGLFHSDELPDYGVSQDEVTRLYNAMNKSNEDAILLVACQASVSDVIFSEMYSRIAKLLQMDMTETRFPGDDGSTFFLRPMPGRERMYPETDVPIIAIDEKSIDKLRSMVPLPLQVTVSQISKKYGISGQDALVMASTFKVAQFEELCKTYNHPKVIARFIMQTLPELEKKYGRKMSSAEIYELFNLAGERNWIREVIERAADLMFSEGKRAADISSKEEILQLSEEELKEIILKLLAAPEKEVGEKNLVAKLKSKTKRPFDTGQAMLLYRSMTRD
ncbi:Glutamyl-tRNA(Gln) amidotransferase subunit E [Thermoplasmatales archaeon]|nr:Glutamyl-tRNA(Gln) amidotransferase subunit E [Thermoplasmatales archaeon]